MKQYQEQYNQITTHFWERKKKKEGEGKETWEKVQSNSVTSKSKKAEIVIMFSIEKMKVIKKEFFLQMKIIGDYSSICRR